MRKRLSRLAFFAITFGFTAFVFMNTYEVVFNRYVPLAQSLQKVAAQDVINGAIRDFSAKAGSDQTNADPDLTGMSSLEFPDLKAHWTVEESRKIDGAWFARPSAGQDIGLNKNQMGVTEDYLVYAIKSWRTLPHPDQIQQGMSVRLHYGHAVSNFTVAEKKVSPLSSSLLVSKSEDRQILLIVEDPHNNLYYGFSLVLQR